MTGAIDAEPTQDWNRFSVPRYGAAGGLANWIARKDTFRLPRNCVPNAGGDNLGQVHASINDVPIQAKRALRRTLEGVCVLCRSSTNLLQ
eukprot:GHVO01027747.1.p4 GENE.GHVO01027747.1~~GHVO01027747.1.p4  ORF type:complete len:103 (+),score=15.77 GHVO01027747.1:41-310(+)